jgi:hypothetical protein
MARHRNESSEDLAETNRRLRRENRQLRRQIEALEADSARDDDYGYDYDDEDEDEDDLGDGTPTSSTIHPSEIDGYGVTAKDPRYRRYHRDTADGKTFGSDIAEFAAEQGIDGPTPIDRGMAAVARFRAYRGRA